ncbi:hypothetical protein D3C81_1565600 [compost metagenome]
MFGYLNKCIDTNDKSGFKEMTLKEIINRNSLDEIKICNEGTAIDYKAYFINKDKPDRISVTNIQHLGVCKDINYYYMGEDWLSLNYFVTTDKSVVKIPNQALYDFRNSFIGINCSIISGYDSRHKMYEHVFIDEITKAGKTLARQFMSCNFPKGLGRKTFKYKELVIY